MPGQPRRAGAKRSGGGLRLRVRGAVPSRVVNRSAAAQPEQPFAERDMGTANRGRAKAGPRAGRCPAGRRGRRHGTCGAVGGRGCAIPCRASSSGRVPPSSSRCPRASRPARRRTATPESVAYMMPMKACGVGDAGCRGGGCRRSALSGGGDGARERAVSPEWTGLQPAPYSGARRGPRSEAGPGAFELLPGPSATSSIVPARLLPTGRRKAPLGGTLVPGPPGAGGGRSTAPDREAMAGPATIEHLWLHSPDCIRELQVLPQGRRD